MRILVISNLWGANALGGYEMACRGVVMGLRARGHEVLVVTSVGRAPELHPDEGVKEIFKLHWFGPQPPEGHADTDLALNRSVASDYFNTYQLLSEIRTFRPDVVYAWNLFGIGGLAMLDLLGIVGAPWVLHLMDRLPDFLLNWTPSLSRMLFARPHGDILRTASVILMSEHLKDEITDYTGVIFERSPLIVPGWAPTPVGKRAPRAPDAPWRFVSAGSISDEKGCGLLLDAAAALVAEGERDFTIDVYGAGAIADFVERAQILGIGDRVRFLGGRTQSELFELYLGYDAFLFPTWEREPFGFAPIEASAHGCPAILTRNCGAAERLVDGVHCLKIERTAEALAEAMGRVMSGEVDSARLGRAAALACAQGLSFEHCLDSIEDRLAQEAGSWSAELADDPKLPLLLYSKHHLAYATTYGVE
jgi:glycosyltransferase involved in cell wall biosynthesis